MTMRVAALACLLAAGCGPGARSLKVDTSDPDAVEEAVLSLMSQLEAEEEDLAMAMKRTVLALEKIGPPAIPTLVKCLESDSTRVSSTASVALGEIGPEAIPALVQALGFENQMVRVLALRTLGNMGPEAEPALEPLFDHFAYSFGIDFIEGRACAISLGNIGEPAVAFLVGKLEDEKHRDKALEALASIGPPAESAIPALMGLIEEDPSSELFNALASVEAPADMVVPAILEIIEKGRPLDEWLASPLIEYGPDAAPAAPLLIKLLAAPEYDERRNAARVLGAIGTADPKVVPALAKALESDDTLFVVDVARALGRIGPKAREAMPALDALLSHPLTEVAASAAAAIEKIMGKPGETAPSKPHPYAVTLHHKKTYDWSDQFCDDCHRQVKGSSHVTIEILDAASAVVEDSGTWVRSEQWPDDASRKYTRTWSFTWKGTYEKGETSTVFHLSLEKGSCKITSKGKEIDCPDAPDAFDLACSPKQVDAHDAPPGGPGKPAPTQAWSCKAPEEHDGSFFPWIFGMESTINTHLVGNMKKKHHVIEK